MTKSITIQRRMQAQMHAESVRREDLFERYSRMLQSGASAATFQVIHAALTDSVADEAIRSHIATLIDQGRDSEMTTQLRAYAVKYLVFPMEIMRKRE